LTAEFGAEMSGPQTFCANLLLERVDGLAAESVERDELFVFPHEVERFDLLAHERIGPVQLLLVLGLGLEVPGHCASLPSVRISISIPRISFLHDRRAIGTSTSERRRHEGRRPLPPR